MHVAIVSDIHGNRHAFEAVLADVADAPARASSGAWATSSATAPTPTTASRWRASTPPSAWPATTTSPSPARSSLDEFSRGAALAARWTQEVHRRRATVEFLRVAEPAGRRARASASTTPARATRSGSTCSRALLAELCLDVADRARLRSSATRTSRCRSSAPRASRRPATTRRDGDELDIADGEWLINPGSVGQPRDGDPRAAWLLLDTERVARATGGAPSTTSPAPRRRSAPPACPTRWPSAWSTVSEDARRAAVRSSPRVLGVGCGVLAACGGSGSDARLIPPRNADEPQRAR